MMRSFKKKKLLYSLIVSAILLIVVFLAWPAKKIYHNGGIYSDIPKTAKRPTQSNSQHRVPAATYSTDQASSLWAVVNKGRALPVSYIPSDLTVPNVPLRNGSSSLDMHVRAETAKALESMFAAAKSEGINLQLESGYRSYSEQQAVYTNYVSASGQQQADTFSARPGHSEHQTGLAADIEAIDRSCEVAQCFADTPAGKWLAGNCYQYGFIIRYQKDAENLTGYEYEPWHVRFVGTELAQKINQTNKTLEQYFNLPIYKNYPTESFNLTN